MLKLIRLINEAGEQQRQTDGQRCSCGRCIRSLISDRKNYECAAAEILSLSGVTTQTTGVFVHGLPTVHGGDHDEILEVSMDPTAPFQKGVAEDLPKALDIFDQCRLTLLVNGMMNAVCRTEAVFKVMCRILRKKNLNIGKQEQINLLKGCNFKTMTARQPSPAYQNSYSGMEDSVYLATESALSLMVKTVVHKPVGTTFPAMKWGCCVGQILSAWVHCSELSEFQIA